jgi:hypothetical protein
LTTKIKRSGKAAPARSRDTQCERLLGGSRLACTHRQFPCAALPKTALHQKAADTPGGHVTISPSLVRLALSCERVRCASNAKCLGELSDVSLATIHPLIQELVRCDFAGLPLSRRTSATAPPKSRCQLPQPNCQRTIWSALTRPVLHPIRHGDSPKRAAIIDRGRTRFALAREKLRTCNRTRPLAI